MVVRRLWWMGSWRRSWRGEKIECGRGIWIFGVGVGLFVGGGLWSGRIWRRTVSKRRLSGMRGVFCRDFGGGVGGECLFLCIRVRSILFRGGGLVWLFRSFVGVVGGDVGVWGLGLSVWFVPFRRWVCRFCGFGGGGRVIDLSDFES